MKVKPIKENTRLKCTDYLIRYVTYVTNMVYLRLRQFSFLVVFQIYYPLSVAMFAVLPSVSIKIPTLGNDYLKHTVCREE